MESSRVQPVSWQPQVIRRVSFFRVVCRAFVKQRNPFLSWQAIRFQTTFYRGLLNEIQKKAGRWSLVLKYQACSFDHSRTILCFFLQCMQD